MVYKERLRFHFKIDTELKNRMINHSIQFKESFSRIINNLFDISYHLLEKYNFSLEDMKFPGEPEQCDDMEVLLDFKYKNILYKMQGDFNLRSKAAVIRHMVRRYFDLYSKHKTEVLLRFFICSFNSWEKTKTKKTVWLKNPPHIWGKESNYLSKTYTDCLLIEKIQLKPPI